MSDTPRGWLHGAFPGLECADSDVAVAYADHHSGGEGAMWIALPEHGRALRWVSVGPQGRSERVVRLSALLGLLLDDGDDETRLSLHASPPVGTMTVLAREPHQRVWLRELARHLGASFGG